MTELVINAPHLQTPGQRFSTALLSFSGWLLWGYFFLPLLFLCGWWLGVQICALWVNLCGGYLGLQKLLLLYSGTILGLSAGWAVWIAYDGYSYRSVGRMTRLPARVSTDEMSRFFALSENLLTDCRESQITTVQFDTEGHIIGLTPIETIPH